MSALSREEFERALRLHFADRRLLAHDASQRGEIARLTARLSDESPGTPLARLRGICEFAEAKCGHNPVAAKPAEVTLMEAFDRLTAERDAIRLEAQTIISNLAAALFPGSPKDSAEGEFALDAMGACQVIRRLRAERDDALKFSNDCGNYSG